MANPDIGLIACPACDFTDAHVRESIKKKAYVVCDECGSQTFARGPLSNERIRSRMRPVVSPDPAPNPAPTAPPSPVKKKAAPTPAPPADGFENWLGI